MNHSCHKRKKKNVWSCYSEKIALEKAAIQKSTNAGKLRSLFQKVPPLFNVNIHEGPLPQDQLTTWARQHLHAPDIVIMDELYDSYLDNWRRAAKPIMLEECRVALKNGCPLTDITGVLSTSTYEAMKADILMELRNESSEQPLNLV